MSDLSSLKPSDAAQRAAALDLGRSFIVQAPAGSGKTELLTQRFLKLLAVVDRPERILAITFTRKATREMRERISHRLQQAASNSAPVQGHEQLAVELAGSVVKKDGQLGWNLLRNPNRLQVFTIDGLCSHLLSRDPDQGSHLAGRVLPDNPRPLYREAVLRLFEHLGQAQSNGSREADARESLVRVLVHLDGNSQALQDLLVSMLQIRDRWRHRMGDHAVRMSDVLRDRQAAELARLTSATGKQTFRRALSLAIGLSDSVDDQSGVAARLADAHAGQGNKAEIGVELAWRFCALLMTASGNPRKPRGIDRRLFKGVPAELQDSIRELKEIYQTWHDQPKALTAIQRFARSPPLDLEPGDAGLREDIRTILMHTLAQLHVLFADRGVADFQFMAESALECLGDEGQPGQVLLDEDLRLGHILMDEFQDTSNTQFELLRRLTGGWGNDGTRSLFLVGDPMQSIYRFREANVGLFVDVAAAGRIGSVPLNGLKLHSNFRSNDEIIDWVNRQFGRIFPSEDQRDSGAVSYTPAHSETGPGGQVAVHPIPPDHSDLHEAQQVVQLIRQAQLNLDAPNIAVLVRARNHLDAIARELIKTGIGFEAVKVNQLASRPVIHDLLAITRALVHRADRVAWLALLRAPWCGLGTAELHVLVGDNESTDVLDRIGQYLGDPGCDSTNLGALRRLHEVLRQTLDKRGSHSLWQQVEFAWLHLGGPYCYATAAELENAECYFRLLCSLEQESSVNLIDRLHEQLQELFAQSKPSRLQLMTIHQAKGLEFDVVIMPGLHRKPGRSDKPLVALQEFRTLKGADAALMAALPARGGSAPSVYAYLDAVDNERSRYETQRLLYVATTRARRQLHLIGRYSLDKDGEACAAGGTFLDLLMPAFREALTARNPQPANAKPAQPPSVLPLLRLINPPRLPEFKVAGKEPELAELPPLPAREASAFGVALHGWLELVHDHWDKGWEAEWFQQHPEALASSLRRAGVENSKVESLLPELTRLLVQTLRSQTGRTVLDPANKAESWSELVLYRREHTNITRHVIDRLYREREGELLILDYKSGDDSPIIRKNWQEQLARYSGLVNNLQIGHVTAMYIHQVSRDSIISPGEKNAVSG